MASCSGDFPFGIMDVVELLQIRVRRRSPQGVYVDCPFCNDRRGKMHVHVGQNTWHCNYCKEGGGMLGLYARMYNTNTSDAFREICDALMIDDHSWGAMGNTRRNEIGDSARSPLSPRNTYAQIDFPEVPQSKLASAQEIHQTYSVLLDSLSLRSSHRAHLRSEKRGLSDEQIERFRFKSTPPPYICRSLTARLIRLGCKVEGVNAICNPNKIGQDWSDSIKLCQLKRGRKGPFRHPFCHPFCHPFRQIKAPVTLCHPF